MSKQDRAYEFGQHAGLEGVAYMLFQRREDFRPGAMVLVMLLFLQVCQHACGVPALCALFVLLHQPGELRVRCRQFHQ